MLVKDFFYFYFWLFEYYILKFFNFNIYKIIDADKIIFVWRKLLIKIKVMITSRIILNKKINNNFYLNNI